MIIEGRVIKRRIAVGTKCLSHKWVYAALR